MSECRLSIHTATYNRGYIIEQAYKSLQNQTCHDFEWVVTDDGSTDNTSELFEKWIKEEKRFKIIYNKIEKGGIPRALNYGLKVVSGDYFFMLDSDDYLVPNAVEKIKIKIKEIDNIKDIVAVGVAKCFPNGEYIKGVAPKVNVNTQYIDATNLERYKYDLDADMAEAYKVDIIRKFPFKVWDGETYAPEQLCFDEMAINGYKVRWYKDKLYICDYLPDGQTKGSWNLLKNNPMGYAMMYNHKLKHTKAFTKRLNYACQHIALSIVGKNTSYILKSNDKLITLICIPLGVLLALRRKKQFKY